MSGPLPDARPLLITDDPVLLDDVLRLAAVAGVELTVVPDPGAARRHWATASSVLVGGDLAEATGRAGLPRRDGIVVVSTDQDDAQVWRRAVTLGAHHVAFLPDGDAWLVDLLADDVQPARGPAPCLAVAGGRGGAGATTLAAALAVTSAREGRRTLLVDADPLGGGIDLALGAEAVEGLRWPQLTGAHGRLSTAALTDALPRVGDLALLSWDRDGAEPVPPAAMEAVLAAGRRGVDLVVVDLPRGLDDTASAALAACSSALLVVPAEVRAAAAAARVATRLCAACSDVRVVARGPGPAGIDGAALARVLGLPLAGELRPEPGLAAAQERGEPPARGGSGPLAALCGRLLAELAGAHPAAA